MITKPNCMPRPPNTHSAINWALHTQEPWLLAITFDSTNLVTRSEGSLRVRWLLLWLAFHIYQKQPVWLQTETRATCVALPHFSNIWQRIAGNHLVNQMTSVRLFMKCRNWRLEREGSLLCSLLVVRILLRISQNLAFQEVLLKTQFCFRQTLLK